jgi:UDP-glucose 4-epimerase
MERTRVLVTGGAGFIGSHLVDRLVSEGHDVVVVDDFSGGSLDNLAGVSDRIRLEKLDITGDDIGALIASVRPERIMHLAAQIDVRRSVADPVFDARTNVVATLAILEAARATGVAKVVIASSGGCVYGEGRSLPLRESARGRPTSPYGISKKVLHDYVAYYRATHGLDAAVLALSNVYGPRQDPHGEAGVVAIFLRAMQAVEPTVIYGDGSQTRDFVYVGDVVDAFARAMERGRGVFNIGTGVQTSVLELWRACAAVTGYGGEPVFADARSGELQHNALDASRAARALGWEPRMAMAEGLRRTAEHIARAGAAT